MLRLRRGHRIHPSGALRLFFHVQDVVKKYLEAEKEGSPHDRSSAADAHPGQHAGRPQAPQEAFGHRTRKNGGGLKHGAVRH